MFEIRKVITGAAASCLCAIVTVSNIYCPMIKENELDLMPATTSYEIINISDLIPAKHEAYEQIEITPRDTDNLISKDTQRIYFNSKLMNPYSPEVGTIEEAVEDVQEEEDMGQIIADIAESMVGTPYCYAGASENGVDCSGLVVYCYSQLGIELPHSSYSLCSVGYEVSVEEIRPGDIICWDNQGGSCGHVGIYIGDGMMVDARGTNEGVIYGSLDLHPILTVRRIF